MSGLLNSIVPYGAGEREGLVYPGTILRGRLVAVGGERPRNAYGYDRDGSERREVLLPRACVYSWLGCKSAREVGNFCAEHARQNAAEEQQSLAAIAEAKARRRRERRAEARRERPRAEVVTLSPEEIEQRLAARRAHRRRLQRDWRARKRAERAAATA